MLQNNPIHFQGSKERLQRIVSRSDGEWLPEKRFEIIMKSYSRNRNGLCFQFRCAWESEADSIRITYRVVPTFFTVLLPALASLFFLGLSIIAVTEGGAAALPGFLLPILMIVSWLRQMNECIRDFRKLFATPTC